MSQQTVSKEDIQKLGTIMFVAAHPDDETFTAAGLLSTAAASGQQVICITATKGEHGVQDEKRWPHEKLGQIRQKEAEKAYKIIGCSNHHWLGYEDGKLSKVKEEEATKIVADYIAEYKPDTILTFDETGFSGHPDHKAVCEWTKRAINLSGHSVKLYQVVVESKLYEEYLRELDQKINIFFMTNNPPIASREECAIYYKLPRSAKETKINALKAMESQTSRMFDQFSEEFIANANGVEAFKLASF